MKIKNFISPKIAISTLLFIWFHGSSIAQNSYRETSQENSKTCISTTNSNFSEIAPVIDDSNSTLYFCRIDRNKNSDGNIYALSLKETNTANALQLSSTINNDLDNAVVLATNNGETLYVEGTYNIDGTPKSQDGISICQLQNGKWTIPQPLKINGFQNKNNHSSYSLSKDLNILIMSIETVNGQGGMDLYVSFRNNKGNYTQPLNLGSNINTNLDECTPFLADDNKTLYFSSYGHNSMGSSDIFMSRRLDNSWQRWSSPENLGNNINSRFWDAYFFVCSDNKTAYFVSAHNDDFTERIYKTTIPENLRPIATQKIEGQVVDNANGKPLSATIEIKSGDNTFTDKTNQKGEFQIVATTSPYLEITVSARGYWPYYGKVSTQKIPTSFGLLPLKKNQRIELHEVFFERQTCNFVSTSQHQLGMLYNVMLQNPNLKIEICGFTENGSSPDKLLQLSEMRAYKVKSFLTDKGINSSRILCKGMGNQKLISNGSSETERLKNRRVEINIINN